MIRFDDPCPLRVRMPVVPVAFWMVTFAFAVEPISARVNDRFAPVADRSMLTVSDPETALFKNLARSTGFPLINPGFAVVPGMVGLGPFQLFVASQPSEPLAAPFQEY